MPARYPERSHGSVYKRFETDAEFRQRLADQGEFLPPWASHAKGEELDHYAWGHLRRQRKIVEVEG